MKTATTIVWDLAGRPEIAAQSVGRLLSDHESVCGMCATRQPRTADMDEALGANFTDRGCLHHPGVTRVCAACLWCCSGKPPTTLRMWSIIAVPGEELPASNPKAWLQDTPGLHLYNRSATTALVKVLANPPLGRWVASVALSGQKHVLPYAVVNLGGGRWTVRVEDHNVSARPEEWRHLRSTALRLRRMGVPADAVMDGRPTFISGGDLAEWRELNTQLAPWLGSTQLGLALWTITKETMNNDT